jgi:hypothetical protein
MARLERLQALSLERQEEEESVSPAAHGGHVGGEGAALNMNESALAGSKRSSVSSQLHQQS